VCVCVCACALCLQDTLKHGCPLACARRPCTCAPTHARAFPTLPLLASCAQPHCLACLLSTLASLHPRPLPLAIIHCRPLPLPPAIVHCHLPLPCTQPHCRACLPPPGASPCVLRARPVMPAPSLALALREPFGLLSTGPSALLKR